MEVSFPAKPRSCFSLAPAAPLSPAKLRLIRRDFLGTSHGKLGRRSGGLLSRRKCRKLNLLQLQSSSPLLVRASLSPVVVVVAVVTLSAISVYYFNQYAGKKRKKKKQVSSTPDVGPPRIGREIVKDLTLVQSLVIQSSAEKKFAEVNESEQGIQNSVERELQPVLQYGESVSVGEETHASLLGSDYNSNTVTSVLEVSVLPPKDEIAAFPWLIHVPQSDIFLPQAGDCEPTGFQDKVNDTEKTSDQELDKLDKSLNEADTDTTSLNGFHEQPVRAELYTFYEPEKSGEEHTKASSFAKVVNGNVNGTFHHSLNRPSMSKGLKLPAEEHTDGNVDGDKVVSLNKQGSPRKRKGTGKVSGIPGSKERMPLQQNKFEIPAQLYKPHGVADNEHWIAEKLSAYNHLLRRGRVNDCVKLLKDMEAVGALDMNKIYHSRFYDTCKSRKAVEEAISFTKLISNPTLSTFNMLMSVCANSQDSDAAFGVLQHIKEAGLKVDCKLYTTLISTCAKCGKVDKMFEVFHEMVNSGVEPNVHTYGALIDGCARVGHVAKAFGAYGIMRSKKVKPDRVVFNALITACGQSGAVDRAFDVLAEMGAELHPIDPDHVTVGALIKACSKAGQVDRAKEVYRMMDKYKIKGTPEVYTITVNCCSLTGDWYFASSVYNDMISKEVVPDEMFLSALIDVAGHAGKLDAAFAVINKAKNDGMRLGIISYGSLMGACSNAKSWEKALEVYDDMKSTNIKPTIPTMNALITALCDGDQLSKAIDVLKDIATFTLRPNEITYSILLVACEKKDDPEAGIQLFSRAKEDGVTPNITMIRLMIGLCLRRYEKACTLGEPISSINTGWPQIKNKWTSLALTVYRESIVMGINPTDEVVSQILGCLHLPYDISLREKIIENLGVSADASRFSNLCSLVEGFGEYDPRAFSLLEEAASLGIVPCVSFKGSPIVIDAKPMRIHTAQVYILTVLRGLKHRLAAGAKLPNITILLPVEKTQIASLHGEKTINVAGRISQAVAALLRRMGLPYQGNESYGKIRINGLALRRWFQPKLTYPFTVKPGEFSSSISRIGKGIAHQQRNIRTGDLSLD